MKITAVVVLYNCRPRESRTLNSIVSNYSGESPLNKELYLVIYDNGLIDQSGSISIPFQHEYIHKPENEGLAKAYNYALRKADLNSSDWLLLLDQDSSLPEDYLSQTLKILECVRSDFSVAAVVPKMHFRNELFSPSRVLYGGIHRPVDRDFKGVYGRNVFAIGSCTLVRTSFMKASGEFNEFFWMDCLDRWLFLTIFRKGAKVYISDIWIEHELSVLDYGHYMNPQRYTNIMFYESSFIRLYMPWHENLFYMLRLLRRAVMMLFKNATRRYSLMTFRHLADILFNPWNAIRRSDIK